MPRPVCPALVILWCWDTQGLLYSMLVSSKSRWTGHFHFCSILSYFMPQATVNSFPGSESSIPTLRSTRDCFNIYKCVYWLKIKKLFKFRQVSTVNYHHCHVPMHICLPYPGCKEITRRAYTFQKIFVLIRTCSKLISLQITGKLS